MLGNKVVSITSGDRAAVLERRDALVTEHLELVRSIARSVARRLPPSFDVDDLIAAGNIALLHVATRYRPGAHNGTPFAAYARPSIRGAIIESIRRRNYTENTRPSIEEMPVRHPETAPVAEEAIDAQRTAARLAEAIGWLPPLQRAILGQYYGTEEPTLAEVGARLACPAQKTRQQHAAAVEALRRRFRVAA